MKPTLDSHPNTDRSAGPSTGHSTDQRVVAVILAAGGGTRFTGTTHKLNAVIDGETIAGRAISRALEADVGEVVVITGAAPIEGLPSAAIALPNPRWADGQATSLTIAVDYARSRNATAIVVGLADQPFVTANAWRAVAASTANLAFATYEGKRGHPVRFGVELWDRLPTTGDAGARELIRVYSGPIDAIPCTGSDVDIDTVEDLQKWQNSSSTNSPSTGPSTRHGR